MRIEKLNKDKIKVTLTTAELINLDIDVKRLSPDSKELHTFLFHIMETIREETGFNPYNGQVVVEATPSQDGISILVKRLNKGIKKITEEQFKKVVSVKPKKKEPGTEYSRKLQIYGLGEKQQIPKENQEYLFALHSSIRTVLHFP